MGNMVLAMPALSDAATLTGSTSPATLPVSNLKTKSIGQVWRALDAQNAYVVIDLGAAKAVNLIALLGHSGSSRASGRIRAAASEADLTDNPAYDSGDLPLRSHQAGFDNTWAAGVADEEAGALDTNHFIQWLGGNAETYRWWRIDVNDPNATYFDAGRLYLAHAWQPETNMNYGLSEGWIDPSRTGRTVGGKSMAVARPSFRWSEFTLSYASKEEMFNEAFDIDRLRGTTRDVLFIVDPDDLPNLQKRTIYGTLRGLQPVVNSSFSIFEKSFRIEEITA